MSNASIPSSDRRRFPILAAVCLAALVLPLSFSGGALATPAIGRALGGDPTALTWITNAFMLSFGSLSMAGGALADQYGRRRVFLAGMTGFTVTSVAAGLAPTVVWLDVIRAAQGIAAAAALSSGSAALAQEFTGHARTRAFSLLGTSFGVGLAFGPLLAGWLVDEFGWRAVFWSTAVVGLSAWTFAASRMRETRDPHAAGLDWPGTLTFTATLTLFTVGVIRAPQLGWTHPATIASMAGSAALLALFVIIESHVARPMLDLSLFRYARFVGVQIMPVGTCYSYIVLVVLLPLRFLGIEGAGEIGAGLLMVALSVPMMIVPWVAAASTRRLSAGAMSSCGFFVAAGGLYWLGHISSSAGAQAFIAPLLLIGLGNALPWGLMDGLSVSVVPDERAGMATGIFSTVRVAGEGIALAVVSALMTGFVQAGLGSSAPVTITAQRLATGDLHSAAQHLPDISRGSLLAVYDHAFRQLTYVLMTIACLSGIAVACFLRPRAEKRTPIHATARGLP